MKNNHRLTEEMEELVLNLQSRVESLQSQDLKSPFDTFLLVLTELGPWFDLIDDGWLLNQLL